MLKQIVIVEGLSHCGKTSVINELKKKLDHKVLVLSTPNKNDLDEIEEYFIAKVDTLDTEIDKARINRMGYLMDEFKDTKSRISIYFDNLHKRTEQHKFPKQTTVCDYLKLNEHGTDIPYTALFVEVKSIIGAKAIQLRALVDMVNLFDQEVTIIVDRFIGSTLVYSPIDIIDMANNPKAYQLNLIEDTIERDILLGSITSVNSVHNFLKYVALTQAPVIPIFISCPVEERARRAQQVQANDESDKAFDQMSLELDTIMSRKYHDYLVFFAEDCACFNPDVYNFFSIPSTTVEDTTKDILSILENKEYYKAIEEA
nr:MAG TPA: Polyphosphate kinase 2 (PPK2) [Caudoviricetes sp.]